MMNAKKGISSQLFGELLESMRGSTLSKLGEMLATKALEDNGFRGVRKITDKERLTKKNRRNYKITYGFLIAKKQNHTYIIEVKTRRKFQKNGKLNERYKLADTKGRSNLYEDAAIAEKHFKASANWIAVQIDNGLYYVYFGSLKQLDGKSGIPMRDSNVSEYKCLAFKKKIADTIDTGDKKGGEIMNGLPVEIHESLKKFKQDHPDPSKAAFIMMQFGVTKAHERIVNSVRGVLNDYGIKALRSDDREYHETLLSNVLTYIYGCNFGIAVFERIEAEKFNPNVAFEVGYMMALKKPVCLLKDKTLKSLHSDLVGKLYKKFDPQEPEKTIATALKKWLKDKDIIS